MRTAQVQTDVEQHPAVTELTAEVDELRIVNAMSVQPGAQSPEFEPMC